MIAFLHAHSTHQRCNWGNFLLKIDSSLCYTELANYLTRLSRGCVSCNMWLNGDEYFKEDDATSIGTSVKTDPKTLGNIFTKI